MTGKVLAGCGHTRRVHATDERVDQHYGGLRIAFECTRSHHGTALVVKIENRCEAEIQARSEYLGRHHPAAGFRQPRRVGAARKFAHRRKPYETLAQPLDAATLLVHRQQQVWPHGSNRSAQLVDLARVLDISGKQNKPADLGLAKQLAILGSQPGTSNVQHQ